MTLAGAFPVRCVVDASVLIKVVLPEPASMLARSLLAGAVLDTRVVPDLVFLECGSILATTVRRGLHAPPDVRAALVAVYRIPLTVHPTTPLLITALDLALFQGIRVSMTAYRSDAAGVVSGRCSDPETTPAASLR